MKTAIANSAPWQPCYDNTWVKIPVKYHFDVCLGKMLNSSPSEQFGIEVPYLKSIHVQRGHASFEDLPKMWANEKEIKQLELKKGDLLVCEGGEVGRAAIVDEQPPQNCIIQNALHRVRSKGKSDVRFLNYLLIQASNQEWFDVLCNRSTIAHFTVERFFVLIICVPDLKTQRRIATYLDRETAQIDALITAKERLLLLLAEKRQALITRAVTRGLDPTVKMKDSGVEWLGEVPEGWEVKKLKYIAKINYGVGSELDKTLTSGISLISLPNVSIDGRLDLSSTGWADISEKDKGSFILKKGDLLFNWRNGSSEHLAKTAIFDSDDEYTHVGFLLRIRFNEPTFDSRYFHALINSLRSTGFFLYSRAMVNNTFNQTELENLFMIVPPEEEQKEISSYLLKKVNHLDALREKTERSITLLKERRSALISAAVTGQITIPD